MADAAINAPIVGPMKRQVICAKDVVASDINDVIAVAVYRQSLAVKNILLARRQR